MKSSMNDKIRETGRKARNLLEEEKRKRREVVRLESYDQEKQTTKSTFAKPVKRSLKKKSKATSSTAMKRRKIGTSGKEDKNTGNVDLWTPDIYELNHSVSREEKSNVIRLHGLVSRCFCGFLWDSYSPILV